MPHPLLSSPLASQFTIYIHPSMYVQIDIIRLILLKLKVEALIRCQCVCKEWRSTIQHPNFKLSYRGERRVLGAKVSTNTLTFTSITNSGFDIETLVQVNRSFLDTFPPLYRWWSGVWCSCNGLVLFSAGKYILLWNPSTHCCTKVLEFRRCLGNPLIPGHNIVSGLCYVSSTRDYKAVLVFRNRPALVASLKNKEWRNVPFPYRLSAGDGVNFRNTPHWCAIVSRVSSSSWRCDQKIIYFEAESDEFKELPTPELQGGKGEDLGLGLGIIDGCLCLCMAREAIGIREEKLDVWVMKEYGVKESWVNQFVISVTASRFFRLNYSTITKLYSSKCNTKVLICSCYYGYWEIFVFDVKNNTLHIFDVKNNTLDNFDISEELKYDRGAICSYVQSIVSPHEFIWTDDQHKASENDAVLRFILKMFNI
ncbi:PREDICTED: F-box/kelch-repeat protein At3g23880-like [Ipomoea nil]|uniref:F-box/kelch-repeat protein At3g23880-like n=1 Tax=Ipomoea nil TaxID=35883 RepID=UPI000900D91D|nr:PREDICTED: F-box/kelch-repeat protein At3g23880-like [Ipomoea nil]